MAAGRSPQGRRLESESQRIRYQTFAHSDPLSYLKLLSKWCVVLKLKYVFGAGQVLSNVAFS